MSCRMGLKYLQSDVETAVCDICEAVKPGYARNLSQCSQTWQLWSMNMRVSLCFYYSVFSVDNFFLIIIIEIFF